MEGVADALDATLGRRNDVIDVGERLLTPRWR